MASGIGPTFILPGGRQLWGNLTGTIPDPNKTPPFENWFGTDPMGAGGRTMDWGRAGGFVSSGPQSFNYQAPNFVGGDPAGAGVNAALYGHTYHTAAGESAYERFNDAGASYLRRYGTDLRDAQGNLIGLSPEHSAGLRTFQNARGRDADGLRYAEGNLIGLSPEHSAGLRTFQNAGGRDAAGNPLYGSQYDTAKTFAGLAQLQQGANPWLND